MRGAACRSSLSTCRRPRELGRCKPGAIAKDGDYFGTMVNLASRVCDRAEPGEVLVSRVVRDLCAGKGFVFVDRGEASLKGFAEPVGLFGVEAAG